MSSRFVSAGAIDPVTGEAAPQPPSNDNTTSSAPSETRNPPPDDKWAAVERELAEERKRKEAHKAALTAGGEKSLFEVLEANKAAKQAAFEEANKIRNQFRALDEDEIDFLDEVKARQRAEEERVKREMEEGVRAFREMQKGGGEKRAKDGGGGEEGVDEEGVEWAAAGGRKRKHKGKGGRLLVKRRTVSESEGKVEGETIWEGETIGKEDKVGDDRVEEDKLKESVARVEVKPKAQPTAAEKPKIGLVSYDSDDSD